MLSSERLISSRVRSSIGKKASNDPDEPSAKNCPWWPCETANRRLKTLVSAAPQALPRTSPVAGIDEHLLFGGLLAYETACSWEAATQARLETKRCAQH